MKKEIYTYKNMGGYNHFLPFLSANIPLNLTLPLFLMIPRRLKKPILFFLFIIAGWIKIFPQQKQQVLHQLNSLLINTVMDDLFTPPVASRIYVYPNIAFYECIRFDDPLFSSLSGKLNGLAKLPGPQKNNNNFISASIAFSFVAQNLVASEYKLEEWRKAFTDSIRSVSDTTIFNYSFQYGKKIADSIIRWIQKDNYLKSRGMMRFVTSNAPGAWQPTPNDYAQGLEPHWKTIRPMTLKSSSQFSPKEKLLYNKSKNSVFFKNVRQVYTIGKNLDSARKLIAMYWDDNPNVSVIEGHLNYFVHKISPGGHWMMIARQACLKKNVILVKTALVYALTGIAIFDGFISCWDEKYKSNLVRPITMINHYIDSDWRPFIQTPPFPEFTSGHSVISNAAATVLTGLLGDNFSFTDNTEIPFGQKPRTFNSFNDAARESSWSRVYGGIHYPETARISTLQGQNIGRHVLKTYYAPVKP
jgi:PAP2 superfamily protein